jgi:hypothetical protein
MRQVLFASREILSHQEFLLSPFSWVADSIALLADLDPTVCVELCKIRRTRVHMIALVLGPFRR